MVVRWWCVIARCRKQGRLFRLICVAKDKAKPHEEEHWAQCTKQRKVTGASQVQGSLDPRVLGAVSRV